MASNNTVLCIHREPTQLSLLRENGYDLVTATDGHEGLQLFMSRDVDAIVMEYPLGLLDGAAVAAEMKQVNPQVPIVMLAEHADLPDDAFKSVDALVIKSDGDHFLLATLHFVLTVKPSQRQLEKLRAPTPVHRRRPARSRGGADGGQFTLLNRQSTERTQLFPRECGDASGMGSSNSD
jgi:CheY-like chemotaxis protein